MFNGAHAQPGVTETALVFPLSRAAIKSLTLDQLLRYARYNHGIELNHALQQEIAKRRVLNEQHRLQEISAGGYEEVCS